MKALCVTENRALELRDIQSPSSPPPGYVNVKITAAAINHGDITFFKLQGAASLATGARLESVWGASAAGTVTEISANVPSSSLGRKVAIYRGLAAVSDSLGLWCETAQIPYGACLLLPDHVDAKDYSGSLVNVVTDYAFLETAAAEGHHGVVVTAGGSATGLTGRKERFSNFETPTVKDEKKKAKMLKDLETYIEDPLFRTNVCPCVPKRTL